MPDACPLDSAACLSGVQVGLYYPPSGITDTRRFARAYAAIARYGLDARVFRSGSTGETVSLRDIILSGEWDGWSDDMDQCGATGHTMRGNATQVLVPLNFLEGAVQLPDTAGDWYDVQSLVVALCYAPAPQRLH
jgi:hypothetical protein